MFLLLNVTWSNVPILPNDVNTHRRKFAKYTHNMSIGNTVITAYNEFPMEFVWNDFDSLDVQQTYHFHKII